MRARAIALAPDAGRLAAAALTAGAGFALWLAAMAPRWTSEALFGPICQGHGGPFAAHCPACYAAAGFVGLGAALAAHVALMRASRPSR